MSNNNDKAYVKVHKSLTREREDQFVEGKKYNIMFIPKGVKVGDMDLSGGVINPIFMQEDKFNKNMMVATFYKTYLQDNAVTVNVLKDGKYEKIKVDVDVLSDKVKEANRIYLEKCSHKENVDVLPYKKEEYEI